MGLARPLSPHTPRGGDGPTPCRALHGSSEDHSSATPLEISKTLHSILSLPRTRLSRRIPRAIRLICRLAAPMTAFPTNRRFPVGEQSNAYRILLRYDRKSRHRRIKKQRRYERLAATSQLSLW